MGFKIDGWDVLTFLVIILATVIFLAVVAFVLGLPGRIAIARKHPEADAVNLMGWLGFLGAVPWIQAFFWAFKPTDIIDIRRTSRQEQRHIEELIKKLKGEPAPPADSKKPPDAGDKTKS